MMMMMMMIMMIMMNYNEITMTMTMTMMTLTKASRRGGTLMFSLMCSWTNHWANNGDAGNLTRHRAHYNVIAIATQQHWGLAWSPWAQLQYVLSMSFHDNSLQWRHNGRDSISNHQPHDCLPNRLFRHRSKKTSKLSVTGLCAGNSPETGEFPAQMVSNQKLGKCFHLMTSSCDCMDLYSLFGIMKCIPLPNSW